MLAYRQLGETFFRIYEVVGDSLVCGNDTLDFGGHAIGDRALGSDKKEYGWLADDGKTDLFAFKVVHDNRGRTWKQDCKRGENGVHGAATNCTCTQKSSSVFLGPKKMLFLGGKPFASSN